MSTQNLHTGPLRSSGHKEASEDHRAVSDLKTKGDGGDPEALLKNRLLDNSQVGRAALYDHDDFLCVASSKQRFKLEPDDIRKIFDGLLTYSRVDDPTAAGGAGTPPKHISLGQEGKADVKDGNQDYLIAELDGKPLLAGRTATYIVLVEGVKDSNVGSLQTTFSSFTEGLQALTL